MYRSYEENVYPGSLAVLWNHGYLVYPSHWQMRWTQYSSWFHTLSLRTTLPNSIICEKREARRLTRLLHYIRLFILPPPSHSPYLWRWQLSVCIAFSFPNRIVLSQELSTLFLLHKVGILIFLSNFTIFPGLA